MFRDKVLLNSGRRSARRSTQVLEPGMRIILAVVLTVGGVAWFAWGAHTAYVRDLPAIAAIVAACGFMVAIYWFAPRSALAATAYRPFAALLPRANESERHYRGRVLAFWLVGAMLCLSLGSAGLYTFDRGGATNGYLMAIGFGGTLLGVALLLKSIGALMMYIRACISGPN